MVVQRASRIQPNDRQRRRRCVLRSFIKPKPPARHSTQAPITDVFIDQGREFKPGYDIEAPDSFPVPVGLGMEARMTRIGEVHD